MNDSGTIVKLGGHGAAERAAALDQAASALRAGSPVALPTETVYCVAITVAAAGEEGGGSSGSGVNLAARFGAYAERCGTSSPLAWHPSRPEWATELLDLKAATHRRLVSRLMPGPVILAVTTTPERQDAVGAALGCGWRVLDPAGAGEVAVRRSQSEVVRELVQRVMVSGDEVLLAELPLPTGRPSWGGRGGWAADAEEAHSAVTEAFGAGAAIVLDDGRSKPGRPATILHLGPGGAWGVRREGAYEERFVRKQLHRNILFVCTGNTCRSPMAEAIAGDLIRKGADGMLPTTVMSAGTGAYPGSPPSEEAIEALREMGITPELRGARPLTRQMIAEADAIFTMSRSHLQAVLAFDPTAAAKAKLLDPEGRDVPDPIGGPQEVYTETAGRIAELVAARLREFDA